MNICIPSQDGRGLESRVHGHFGSAPWFTLVNTETGEVSTVENPSCHSSSGSCHHVGMLAKRHVTAVASAGIGRRACQALRDAGIEVFVAAHDQVGAVAASIRGGEATRLAFEQACAGGFHHGRGQGHGRGHGGRRGCD